MSGPETTILHLHVKNLSAIYFVHQPNIYTFLLYTGVHFGTLDKTVYLGNRQFLPHDSALRKDCGNFPDKKCEERSAPEVYQQKELTAKHRAYASAPSKAKKADIAKATGCQGGIQFYVVTRP